MNPEESLIRTIEEATQRKDRISAIRPFENKAQLENIKEFYRYSFVWSSNTIEGNTLTLGETESILRDEITIGGHPLKETLEAIGGNKAYDYMFSLLDKKTKINLDVIKHLHSLCAFGQEEISPGEFRRHNVIITGFDNPLPQ